MLKKSITYENPFTNEEVTEEHYFYISKGDLAEMEIEDHNLAYKAKDGQDYTGFQAKMMKIVDSEDGKAIIVELKDIIRRSFCQRVGDKPVKSKEIADNFMSSEAAKQLLYELCTDAELAANFANSIIPTNLAAEAQAMVARQSADISDREEGATVTSLPSAAPSQGGSADAPPRMISRAEALEMSSTELQAGLASGRLQISPDGV